MYNKFFTIGNLTKDIDFKTVGQGTNIAKTAIATSKKYTTNGEKKEDVMFMDVTFWGRTAEVARDYLKKGSKVSLTGTIKFEQWEAEDGTKRSKHVLNVEDLTMLNTKEENEAMDSESAPEKKAPAKKAPAKKVEKKEEETK